MARVIVIGAGAAGLLAAGRAAQCGADVLLLEKMPRPARKLRITGKGRCNVSNSAPLAEFLAHFGDNRRWLRPALARFFRDELLALLAGLGVEHVVERGGRIFPASERAQDVVDALLRWVKREGVSLRCDCPVRGLLIEDGVLRGVASDNGLERADAVVLATGGASYAATGSSGDGYAFARQAGHGILPIRPALVPLICAGDIPARLQGLSLRNVELALWCDGRKSASTSDHKVASTSGHKVASAFGEMVFTKDGVSGPVVLGLSKQAGDLLADKRRVDLSLDLKPALSHEQLDARLLREITSRGRRQLVRLLGGLLPRKLIPVCLDAVDLAADLPSHALSSKQRKRLRLWLKDFRLELTACRPLDEAIVTAGGVSLDEVDPRTMASRRLSGLYLAGELLDLDADTGGFNVQAAFSTGWVAGESAADVTVDPDSSDNNDNSAEN